MDICSAPMYKDFDFRDTAIAQDSSGQVGTQGKYLRWPASPESGPENKKYRAAWLGIRVVLKNYRGMFMSRKQVTQSLLDQCGAFVKQEIKRTGKDVQHRTYLGNSGDLWTLLSDVFEVGTRVLRLQSFPDAPTYDEHGCSFSNFMASNHITLIKDIERLNDLLSLARNMLATTTIAQEAAASAKFDQQVVRIIDACIRVTARGYDGEPANVTEQKWATLIAAYKKLTMTALQWLYTFTLQNEQRKLHLFHQLFGDFNIIDPEAIEGAADLNTLVEVQRHGGVTDSQFNPIEFHDAPALKVMDEVIRSVRGYCRQTMRHVPDYPIDFPEAEYSQFLVSVATSLKDKHHNGLCGDNVPNFAALSTAYFRLIRNELTPVESVEVFGPDQAHREILDAKEKVLSEFLYQLDHNGRDAYDQIRAASMVRQPVGPTGLPPNTPGTYQETEVDVYTLSDDTEDDLARADDGDDEEEEDEDSEDEIGSPSRGLLTDIPLVLGPNEIEALPLMIQSAIRSTADPRETIEEVHVMQALRCYRMISESAGKNLLRELLIFIAAWDLQEQDQYFKWMMNIMETILSYGLMPYAFDSFREDKDVVSPAQSILIKLLTNMFRKRQAAATGDYRDSRPSALFPAPPDVEATIVRYIFMVFRSHIIPQTCALIYLQGQIRDGKVMPEDFPLNLWDMERVYEGVYQFLEFFAVLTETEEWKALLVKEEIVFELITLLSDLDKSIPKSMEIQPPMAVGTEIPLNSMEAENQAQANILHEAQALGYNPPAQPPAPVAVERPYDPSPAPGPGPAPAGSTDAVGMRRDASQDGNQSETASAMMENNIEPADFEWRNLKKLVVLVLSSLVWRSNIVQDQIRAHNGVEMILNCCNADGNNPYIKDHAVMCLRFLVEGSHENQQIVRQLEERRALERPVREAKGKGRHSRPLKQGPNVEQSAEEGHKEGTSK